MSLNDIIERITDNPDLIRRWKSLAAKEIKAWAKRTNPFRYVKPTNYYLYIDIYTKKYSIIFQGVKPNAASARRFNAPVGKYYDSQQPHHEYFYGSWHTVQKERATSSSMGVMPLDTTYYGVSGMPDKYYGIKKGSKIRAYGLYDDGSAVPVYSDGGFVEWITETNINELYGILYDSFNLY